MKVSATTTIIGGGIAFLLATACCWLPVLLLSLGGAAGMVSFSEGLEKSSGLFMGLGAVLFGLGMVQIYKRRNTPIAGEIVLISTITCPECGYSMEEKMPTDSCQFFYECKNCKAMLKPQPGDCCVYCSYGNVACPPVQKEEDCC